MNDGFQCGTYSFNSHAWLIWFIHHLGWQVWDVHKARLNIALLRGIVTYPSAYFATLPIKNIVNALHQNGIPAKVSNTAGTFVCNHLMYGVCHYAAQKGTTAMLG